MDDGLRENDPSRAVLESGRSGVTPGFLGGSGGGDRPAGLRDDKKKGMREKVGGAQNELKSNEDGASKNNINDDGFYRPGDGIDNTRGEEEKARGFYSNDGKNKNSAESNKKKKGLLKKSTPLTFAGIIIAIVGFGMISFGNLSSQIIAWKENITSMFGQNSAIIGLRANYRMKKLLSGRGSKTKMTPELSNKLKAQGINYVEVTDADGNELRMLVFEDPDGRVIPIVGDDGDVSRANKFVGTEVDVDGKKIKITDSGTTLASARKTNKNFKMNYDTATISFTGKIAGWFDDMADLMLKRVVGDNARNQTDIDEPTQEKVDEMMMKNKSEGIEDSEISATKEDTDEDGNTVQRPAEGSDELPNGKTYAEVEAESGKVSTDNPKADAISKGLSAKAQKVAMLSSSLSCAVLRGIGAISMAIGAVQTMNVISHASKMLEIADKTKYGDGDETTNLALNNVNKSVKTKLYDLDGKEVEVEGAITESDGFNAPFATENIIDEDDPSSLIVNREYATKSAIRSISGGGGAFAEIASAVAGFGGGIMAFKICNGVQAVAGLVDGITDIASIFTFGVAKGVKEIIKGAVSGARLAGAMVLITSVIAVVTPTIANWFSSKLPEIFLGLPGGSSLQSGAANIFGSNLQMSSGRYANKENAIEVFALTNEAEKEWAEYERTTKSPFDITSEYTFLGSLYSSFLPIMNKSSGGTIMSTVSSIASLTGDSAIALVNPSVSAANEVGHYAISIASDSNCGYLKSVGVAGDFACNKYAGAYVNALTTEDPDAVAQRMQSYGSFDGEDAHGNPKVKSDSDYAKYIVACVTSDTQPGTMNAAVEGYIQKATTSDNAAVNGLLNFGANFVPFEGFVDAIDAAEQERNFKWNSGLACTGNTGDAAFDKMMEDFSTYNIDQRVGNDMGLLASNSTVAFLEEYYEENPLDRSFEGQIARISGMTKEEVSDTLALIEYYNYIANYDPSDRYAFGEPRVEIEKNLMFDNENTLAEDAILLNEILFADVRNRTFAV
ncbi:hypothetical protein IKG33_02805 [Candidatus Saccharibacteria bacterium]|nr:hypothetical protein [Candidatus Saccharibacteria bacterium]